MKFRNGLLPLGGACSSLASANPAGSPLQFNLNLRDLALLVPKVPKTRTY